MPIKINPDFEKAFKDSKVSEKDKEKIKQAIQENDKKRVFLSKAGAKYHKDIQKFYELAANKVEKNIPLIDFTFQTTKNLLNNDEFVSLYKKYLSELEEADKKFNKHKKILPVLKKHYQIDIYTPKSEKKEVEEELLKVFFDKKHNYIFYITEQLYNSIKDNKKNFLTFEISEIEDNYKNNIFKSFLDNLKIYKKTTHKNKTFDYSYTFTLNTFEDEKSELINSDSLIKAIKIFEYRDKYKNINEYKEYKKNLFFFVSLDSLELNDKTINKEKLIDFLNDVLKFLLGKYTMIYAYQHLHEDKSYKTKKDDISLKEIKEILSQIVKTKQFID